MKKKSKSKLTLLAKERLLKSVFHTRTVLLANAPIAMMDISMTAKLGFAMMTMAVLCIELLSAFATWVVVKAQP